MVKKKGKVDPSGGRGGGGDLHQICIRKTSGIAKQKSQSRVFKIHLIRLNETQPKMSAMLPIM